MKKLNAQSKNERVTNQLSEDIDYNFDDQGGFVELDIVSIDEKSAAKPRINKSYLNETEPGTPRSRLSLKNAAENSSQFRNKKVRLTQLQNLIACLSSET